jgi:hypothetical protein
VRHPTFDKIPESTMVQSTKRVVLVPLVELFAIL